MKKGFTLVELLVVIGIVAILATIVVLVINPVEILKESRDSRRLSDLGTLNKALGIVEATISGATFGVDNTIYISLPDTVSTCGSYPSLPLLPNDGAGGPLVDYVYNCVTSANLRTIGGSGWVPVNFQPAGPPFSVLPIDPINDATQGLYYTYQKGSFKLSSKLESEKRLTKNAATDGGLDPTLLEMGSDLTKPTPTGGLVGYWKFDEVSGTEVTDSSGFGNTGSMAGGDLHTSSNCKKGFCASFDGGTTKYINIPYSASLRPSSFTILAWARPASFPVPGYYLGIITNQLSSPSPGVNLAINSTPNIVSLFNGATYMTWSSPITTNTWYHVAVSHDGSDNSNRLYVGGTRRVGPTTISVPAANTATQIGRFYTNTTNHGMNGLIDEVLFYNRALSENEIKAIYSAGQ